MKKINLLIIVSVLVSSGFAQQFPLQSQYQFNYPTINPAANGENDFYRVRASFREQWVGFAETPISTQILTVTKRFKNNGLGATVFSDKTAGYFNTTGYAASYSQRVKFERSDLFLGISAGTSSYNLGSIDDPAILSNKSKVAEVAFGVYYVNNNFRFGISVPGLLNKNIEISNSDENTVDRHFYTMLSYQKKINNDWSIYPSILVKTTTNHNQIDANVNFKIKNSLWFGASYRSNPGEVNIDAKGVFGPSFYLGFDLGRLLAIYSYDISSADMSSFPTHELTFGYDFIPEEDLDQKIVEKELIFDEDKDKDGVKDDDDICPNEYGDSHANGCPDFDKDGIPDKYDLCPHLFGVGNIQGCPELAANESIILSKALGDLNFDFDKAVIKYESFSSLTNLAILMHQNTDMILFIEGHASAEGSASYNLSLSARRAKQVQKFFIGRGVKKGRLIIDFHGEESPLNFNITDKDKEKNRRVEFDIKYHLYDTKVVGELKNEYDSLLNEVLGVNTFLDEKQEIEVFQEAQIEKSTIVAKEKQLNEVFLLDTVVDEENQETGLIMENEVVENIIESDEEKFDEDIIQDEVSIEEDDFKKYLVIVQVFNDLSNAMEFTYGKVLDLQYIYLNEKYYIYAFASKQRSDAEKFRAEYQKECWILDPK